MGTGARVAGRLTDGNSVLNQPYGTLIPDGAYFDNSFLPAAFWPELGVWPTYKNNVYNGKQVTGILVGPGGNADDLQLKVYGSLSPRATATAITQSKYDSGEFSFFVESARNYTYVVEWFLNSGQSVPYYVELSIDEGGNLPNPKSLGTLNNYIVTEDFVGLTDPLDHYEFTVNSPGSVTISLSKLNGNADLVLARGDNSEDIIRFSSNGGTINESITENLSPGTYKVLVSAPEASGDSRPIFNNLRAYNQAVANLQGAPITISSNYRLTIQSDNAPDPLTGMNSPTFRFYERNRGFHFYTSSAAERDWIRANLPQYNFEGSAFNVANTKTSQDQIELYRFYNTAVGNHFFTTSAAERDQIRNTLPQYNYEGTAFYVRGASDNVGTDVYRFYNTQTGAHFFTASADERNSVINTLPMFRYEGVAFEVV